MTQETTLQSTPRETLRVQNFAGMTDVTLELSRMNVLIGPSASGKSVCAKLLFYFKKAYWRMLLSAINDKPTQQMHSEDKALFLKYFPSINWGEGDFTIEYAYGTYKIQVQRKGHVSSTVQIVYSPEYNMLARVGRQALRQAKQSTNVIDKNFNPDPQTVAWANISANARLNIGVRLPHNSYFIPAGRSFFSTFQDILFTLLTGTTEVDPFLAEFGYIHRLSRRLHSTRENGSSVESELINTYTEKLLCGIYRQTNNKGYIDMSDGRKVSLENASSGQQEALPLALFLNELVLRHLDICNIFVEEPEAHLYPNSQRDIVHLMAAVTDLFEEIDSNQYVLTTHSPYILSALNNLMYGGKIVKETPEKKDKVTAFLPEAVLVNPANVRAYMMENGEAKSIISEDSGLIVASEIDGVSNELGSEFNQLLDIEFDEDEAAA